MKDLKHAGDLTHDDILKTGQYFVDNFTKLINEYGSKKNICVSCLIPLAAAALAAIASIVNYEEDDDCGQTKH